jgi:hypothetical protein
MVIGVTVWTAAATFEPSAGAAVVVVVAAVVVVVGVVTLDCRTTVRAPSVELVDWDGGGEVGGVTVLGPRTVWVVVVVVAVGAVDLLWWGFAGSSGAAALPSVGFG